MKLTGIAHTRSLFLFLSLLTVSVIVSCKGSSGPTELWRSFIGAGYAPVAVRGNCLYAVGRSSGGGLEDDVIVCLNKRTGKQIWAFHYKPAAGTDFVLPCNAPVLDNRNLYYLSPDGRLLCLDRRSGAYRWDADLIGLGAEPRSGGFRGSPVISGNGLVVNAFSSGAAFDPENGRPLWISATGPGGQSSPFPFEYDGSVYLAIVGKNVLNIVQPEDGTVVASVELENSGSIGPLLLGNGLIYLENTLLQFDGRQVRVLKQYDHLDADFSQPVLSGGLIYGFLGSPQDRRTCRFSCFDPQTGDVSWTEPTGCYGTVLLVDDILYALNENGYLFLVKPDPSAYNDTFLIRVFDEHWGAWTPPAAESGILYFRSNSGDLAAIKTGQ